MMEFVKDQVYLTREGREYFFVERRGGILVFDTEDKNSRRLLTNLNGKFRWDEEDHPYDIVSKK